MVIVYASLIIIVPLAIIGWLGDRQLMRWFAYVDAGRAERLKKLEGTNVHA